jgi:hypothetical protein
MLGGGGRAPLLALPNQIHFLNLVIHATPQQNVKWSCKTTDYTRKNLTTCQQEVFATGLYQACQQVLTVLLFYQAATRLSLTTC